MNRLMRKAGEEGGSPLSEDDQGQGKEKIRQKKGDQPGHRGRCVTPLRLLGTQEIHAASQTSQGHIRFLTILYKHHNVCAFPLNSD